MEPQLACLDLKLSDFDVLRINVHHPRTVLVVAADAFQFECPNAFDLRTLCGGLRAQVLKFDAFVRRIAIHVIVDDCLDAVRSIAEELRGTGVSVTALCPGITDTHMVDEAMAGSDKLRPPGIVVGDAAKVAREGFRGCMKGETVVVPGTINQALQLTARTTPKWLLQRLTGLMGRSTI